jgi:type I restriction enzyme S subunit
LRVDPNIADPVFCFYYFASPRYAEYIRNRSIGGAVPGINLGILKSLPIALPPIKVQKEIAEVLSAYDGLIENNRRRMELLEDAARQLYREWFVRLRFPGREHTRIINGVPEKWDTGIVSDFYDTGSGGTPSRKNSDYFVGDIPWVKTQKLPNGFITDTEEKITDEALKNSAAKLLPEKTVLIAMYGATVGELGILAMPATTNQACCALLPRDSRASYIHSFLFFRENKDRLVGLSAGSAQNNISQQIIRAYEMVMPTKALTDAFVAYLEPVFNQWLNLHRQNQKLRAARDLLLPRLMSGEIAV